MIPYYGDFAEDDTVNIPFNTFSSDDPSASVTITNFADADIKVHKDAHVDQIVTDGATVVINFDGITGNHMINIDTSVDAAYATGSEYQVRVEGTTIDGATINAWVGAFSIERAGGVIALLKLIQAAVITNAAGADVAADIIAVKAETALIVADTNELQVDNVPGLIGTAQADLDIITGTSGVVIQDGTIVAASLGADCITSAKIANNAIAAEHLAAAAIDNATFAADVGSTAHATNIISQAARKGLDDYDPPTRAELTTDKNSIITEIDANETKIDTVLVDTNELQTDWANGGRLDLLLDAVKAKTDNLPSGISKNTALNNFEWLMVLSSNHISPATGKTVACQRSIDGGAFANCATATATEVSAGVYKLNLAASDLNGDVITFKFSEANCDTTVITIKTDS